MPKLRYALRSLRNAPGFTAAAVLTLALGIGANTAAFSVVHALLLRPLPVEDPGALVQLHPFNRNPATGELQYMYAWSFPDYLEHRARDRAFAGLAAYESRSFVLGGREPRRVPGASVTGEYFGVLGVRALHGRTLLPSDDRASDPATVPVVSEEFWRSRMGADPRAVGTTITLEKHRFTVVGVAGSGALFRAMGGPQVWVPMHTRAALLDTVGNRLGGRNASWAQVVGRLRPGVAMERAQAEVELTDRRLAAAYPHSHANRLSRVVPSRTMAELTMPAEERPKAASVAALLMGVVALVLLAACANVANLLLARAAGRRREISIRLAMGAGRGQIARQILAESVLLALLGGAAGAVLAWGGVALAARIPRVAQFSPALDLRVLAFTFTLSLLAGVAFGMVPAAGSATRDLVAGLRDGGARGGTRRSPVQRLLVVGQVAVSLVLVAATGLVLRSLEKLSRVDPGFEYENLLVAQLDLAPPGGTVFDPPSPQRVDEVLRSVRALPGVSGASFASLAPMSGMTYRYGFEVEGYTPPPGEELASADAMVVDDAYLGTLGIPLLRGRAFAGLPGDDRRHVLVNRTFAARFWPGRDPVGRRIRNGDDWLTVAGVVGDVRAASMGAAAEPTFYMRFPFDANAAPTLHVRTSGDPRALVGPVRRALAAATPGLPAPEVKPLAANVAGSMAQARWVATFFTVFGGLTLLLAAVGLYGVVSYSISQRTREMGIRAALGAAPARIVALVLRQGVGLAMAGVVLGLAGAAATTHLIGAVLYAVEPVDPLSFGAAVAVLAASAAFASWIPARRAARVDPMAALRSE
ncbi:MAG: Acidobacterial duplicated orphan permease (function unknown) [uncultured Gemmatimonadetes bacterium]|uniref:ABC transporter permease n=1 Tax=uncultured Gemmatimonadota bacterium TaxID=203437 RepID=A0A6J4K3N6_9BACT|nr:MAG: Acidobacterial duplicated orphan permease (function unknown) [uncultured Gemmatimonadota bacterium]